MKIKKLKHIIREQINLLKEQSSSACNQTIYLSYCDTAYGFGLDGSLLDCVWRPYTIQMLLNFIQSNDVNAGEQFPIAYEGSR